MRAGDGLRWSAHPFGGDVLGAGHAQYSASVPRSLDVAVVMNPTSIYEDGSLTPDPALWVKDLVWLWLWLWCGLAAAAPIQPLAWERPYASGMALKGKKKK